MSVLRLVAVVWLVVSMFAAPAAAQMDLRQASGVPLPAADLPAGAVSVRVVRGSFANNLAGQSVVFTVNGADRTMQTDESGRAQISGLPSGARVQVATIVDGERIVSQETTIAATGIRFVLVATDPNAPAGAAAPTLPPAVSSNVPAVAGSVVLGPESRIVIDFADEQLNIYYVVQIMNGATSPVDIGGPLVFELPQGARSATVMDGSSPSATANGPRVTVTGPFAPGRTNVNIAFSLPFTGDTAELEQVWPAAAQGFSVFALQTGNMDIASPQMLNRQASMQQGQPIVAGNLPAMPKGQPIALTITGLPSHSVWPRNTAFGAVALISAIGLWAAFGPASRRRPA